MRALSAGIALATTAALVAACLLAGGAVRAGAAGPSKPAVVLGWKGLWHPNGRGWGTEAPAVVYNGGDPSGFVMGIRWSGWGDRQAIGYGLGSIPDPAGGYYPGNHHTIEMRASDIGRCTRNGPLAYRRLQGREPNKPGAPLGAWFAWAGLRSICSLALGAA